MEDLGFGSFYIIDTDSPNNLRKMELKIKETLPISIEINNAITATEKIIAELNKKDLEDKIVLLRLKGDIQQGKNSDIKFQEIEEHVKSKGAYFLLKNTHELTSCELELEIDVKDSENVEEETIKIYSKENPSDLNALIPQLMSSLSIEKQEDEKTEIFNNRILDNAKKILKF